MKKLQSIVAGLLSVCLLTCSASAMSFPDVPEDSLYATAIENISDLGIMVGGSNGNFNPDQIVSRCEMATIVCRVLGTTENLSKSEVFNDVPVNHWANAYIARASQLGIVAGYGNGKFGPGDPVTYEQSITMLIRAIGEGDSANSKGGYPKGFIAVAEERFLLEGIPVEQGQGMTRGAVAMLLNNYYTWMPAKPGDGHTHHYDDSATIRICALCGQMDPSAPSDGHTHRYIEKTVPGSGTGGHYEQVQVQVGTKTVNEYATVTTYGCRACSFTTTDPTEIRKHGQTPGNGCYGGGWWSTTKNTIVGTHEEPNYETRTTWVSDSATTIRICEICGQQEP